jgi:hypothetical protein
LFHKEDRQMSESSRGRVNLSKQKKSLQIQLPFSKVEALIRKKNVLNLNQRSIEDVRETLAQHKELERESKKVSSGLDSHRVRDRGDNILVEERPVVAKQKDRDAWRGNHRTNPLREPEIRGSSEHQSSMPEVGMQRQMDYNEWFEHVHGRPAEANGRSKYYNNNAERRSLNRDSGYDSRDENFQLPAISSGFERRQVSKQNLGTGIGKGTGFLSKMKKQSKPISEEFRSIDHKPSKRALEPVYDFTSAPNL